MNALPEAVHPLVAADIMTHDVVTVRAGSPLSDAVQLMLTRHVSGLPVLGPYGELVGMLTENDLLRRTETGTEAAAGGKTRWLQAMFDPGRLAGSFARAHGRIVSEVMTPEIATVTGATPVQDIVTLMQGQELRQVAVMDGARLAGIVARSDLIRALGRLLQARATGAPLVTEDAAIRHTLEAGLADAAWARQGVTFTVTDGRVHLYGAIRDHRDRTAIQVTAENVPGVVSVDARFTDPDQDAVMGLKPNG